MNKTASDIKKLAITDIVDANEEYSYINISGRGVEAKNTISIFDEDGIKVATTTILEDGTWSAGISNFAGTPVSNKEFFKAIENDIAGNEIAQIDSNHYWTEKLDSLDTQATVDFVMTGIEDDEINTDTMQSLENENTLYDAKIEDDISQYDMRTVSEELAIVESLENIIEEDESEEINSIDEENIEYEDELDYIEDDFLDDVQMESLPTTKALTLTGIEGSVEDEIILEQSNNEDTKTENDDVSLDEQELEVKVPMDNELSNNAANKSDEIDINAPIDETKEVLEYTKGWAKSTNQMKDGDATFEVWTKDNATVYIDTSTSVTDI